MSTEEKTEVRLSQKEASVFLDVSISTLKNWEKRDWWPSEGRTPEGYDVGLIQLAKEVAEATEETPTAKSPKKFRAACPRSEFHAARVKKTAGRIRYCVCESCGHTWKQVGPVNPHKQVLEAISGELQKLQVVEAKGQKIVVLKASERDAIVELCQQ